MPHHTFKNRVKFIDIHIGSLINIYEVKVILGEKQYHTSIILKKFEIKNIKLDWNLKNLNIHVSQGKQKNLLI